MESLLGGALFRFLLGASGSASKYPAREEHLGTKEPLVLEPLDTGDSIGGGRPPLALGTNLERALEVGRLDAIGQALQGLVAEQAGNEEASRVEPLRQVDRGEQRLEGVGEQGAAVASAGALLTVAKEQEWPKTDRSGARRARRLVDDRGAEAGQHALRGIGRQVEDEIRNDETKDGVAQHLETLVVAGGVLGRVGAVGQGLHDQ